MAQELPFLNMTAEDVKALTPINSQCTVLCEIDRIWAKEGKSGGTNVYFNFTCIDDNSPEKGRPSMKSFSLGYPRMFVPLLCAALKIEKEEIVPEQIDLNKLMGKQLLVKFDLRDNGKDEFVIQPVDYFRSDKPVV
jgi:hypothetical protein